MFQPNSSIPNRFSKQELKERDRISLEIRQKYGKHPEAILHAAMLTHRDQGNVSAHWVHKKILEDPQNGDVFMEAFESRNKEPAKKMPVFTALAFVLNQVHAFRIFYLEKKLSNHVF